MSNFSSLTPAQISQALQSVGAVQPQPQPQPSGAGVDPRFLARPQPSPQNPYIGGAPGRGFFARPLQMVNPATGQPIAQGGIDPRMMARPQPGAPGAGPQSYMGAPISPPPQNGQIGPTGAGPSGQPSSLYQALMLTLFGHGGMPGPAPSGAPPAGAAPMSIAPASAGMPPSGRMQLTPPQGATSGATVYR